MLRKKLMAANWKMYKSPLEARDFVRAFAPLVAGHTRDEIVLCAPFVCIPATVEAARGSNAWVGAQDLFWEKEGAYTGEVSGAMLSAFHLARLARTNVVLSWRLSNRATGMK